ncbi:hypothetical protein [Myroides pelagicus]|uniref:Lipoprotein n=1 Tax=Myroides pelagicus TaxID=270914 RepID=A0A7K1GQM2_9FLAO|nr:hypothetical protein [Myroides pelagicus]MTH31010.1 hypothetical protein [Myroides pelagicus]
MRKIFFVMGVLCLLLLTGSCSNDDQITKELELKEIQLIEVSIPEEVPSSEFKNDEPNKLNRGDQDKDRDRRKGK